MDMKSTFLDGYVEEDYTESRHLKRKIPKLIHSLKKQIPTESIWGLSVY